MYDWITSNVLTISLIAALTALYLYLSRDLNYFKSRGINGPKPVIFFGSFYKLFYTSLNEIVREDYNKYGRIYGWFFGTRPVLMVSEPRLYKDILIKDFHKFVDRNDFITGDPFSDRQLTQLLGDEWKKIRAVVSPTFSSGKMKRMHPLIEDCEKSVDNVLKNAAINKNEIDVRKLMGHFTLDVIASCAFATKIDTHNEPNNPFVKHAAVALRGSLKVWFSFIMLNTFKERARKLNLPVVNTEVKNFFTNAIISIIKQRENKKENHIDFLQLMLNAKNRENLDDDDEKSNNSIIHESSESQKFDKTKSKVEISDTDIIASSFIFFIAGYETTAALLTFLSYSLALHEDVQQKLYEELKSVERLDYDTIANLPYLDACIHETQRLYPSVGFLNRIASEDYKLGDTGITIPKGMLVQVNVDGIHHDPEYYPNPDRFDPERFMPENREKLIPYTFLPFGIGPRNCVGMRFALMEAKTAIAHIITKFKFVRTANTVVPMSFALGEFLLAPKSEVRVGVEIRSN